ncbi:MAG: hypothetical protein ACK5XB_14645 [Rhodospirillales bacterium]
MAHPPRIAGAALALAFFYLGLALRPFDALLAMPIAEDGWYALTVARNVANGHGITIDGTVWTNGFQPLFTALQVLCFWFVPTPEGELRLFYGLAWLVHCAGAMLVASLARDAVREGSGALAAPLAALLYLAAIKNFNDFYTGLETGLQLALYALVWRFYANDWRQHPTLMGLALGALVLARIDAAVFVAVFCAVEFLRGGASWAVRFRTCFIAGAVAVLVSSPWWLYNTLLFGHPMPSSGFAQQDAVFDIERIWTALWALRIVAMPWLFAGAHESLWTDIARIAALLGVCVLVWCTRDLVRASALLRFAGLLLLCYAGLVVYYTRTFFADWFYIRYFAPLSLIAFVYLPALLAARLPRAGAAMGIAASLVAAMLLAGAWQSLGLFGASAHHRQAALVAEYVPPEDVVAAGQSGTLGFLRDRVVNVDGKVNPEALKWRGRIPEYLDVRGIRWFVDSDWYVEINLGLDPAAVGWQLVAENGDFYLYRRVGR